MANDNKKNELDTASLQLLETASKQYEEYLKITASAALLPEAEQGAPAKPNWTHPMGLVVASSR